MKKDFLPAYLIALTLTTFCILASSQTNASFFSKGFLLTEEEKKIKASRSEEKEKAPPFKQEKKEEKPFFKGGFFVSKTPVKNIVPTPEKNIEIKKIDEWEKMTAPTLWTVDKLKDHPLCQEVYLESLKHVKSGMWFSHLWNNKEKSVQYLKLVMSRLNLEDCISSETFMISFNATTDLRIALLYTLTQCKPGLPILDAGSGYGFMARNMLTLGANVRLVDNNQKSLDLAVKHFEEKKEFLPSNYKSLYTLEKSDIKDKNAPFYKQKYWIVNCEKLLHFMPPSEIHVFLDRIYETLYPGGLFFANVVAVFMTQERINEYLEGRELGKEFPLEGQYRANSKEPIYDILIAREELTNIIKKHGFFIEKSFYIDSLGNETNEDCFTPNPIGQTVSTCVIARRPLNTIPKEIIFEPVKEKAELIEKREETKPFFRGGFFVTPPKKEAKIKTEETKPLIKKGFLLNSTPPKKEPKIKSEKGNTVSHPFFKGGFFVTKSPLQNSPSKKIPEPIIEIKKMDEWSQMKVPTLWTVDELKFHPLCWKANQNNPEGMKYTKRGLWFINLWKETERTQRYFNLVMMNLEVNEAWDAETPLPSFNALTDLRIALLYTLTECKRGVPILEAGGGTGYFAHNLLVLGANVTLVDKNKKALERAEKHFETYSEFLPFDYKKLYTLENSNLTNDNAPFYKEKYWMINCEQVLNYLKPEEINNFLKRAYNSLYPGGFLFANVTATFFMQEDINSYLEGRKLGKEFPLEGGYGIHSGVPIYSIFIALEELTNVIKKHGFSIKKSFYIDEFGNETKKDCLTPIKSANDLVSACVIARKPENIKEKK